MNAPYWEVQSVHAQPDYSLLLTFASGERRRYDARPLLAKPIYSRLNVLSFFLSAKAEYGTVVWDDDTDIAPEHLWEASTPIQ